MTDRNFNKKLLNLALVVLVLAGYQTAVHVRAQDAQIAQLKAEVDAYEEAVQAANKAAGVTEGGASGGGASYNDGTYEGTADGFGGPITVSVVVKDGKITSVDVTEADGEDPAYYESAVKAVPDAIVEAQSADVDTVSGATFSSTGIREAARQALEQAVAE